MCRLTHSMTRRQFEWVNFSAHLQAQRAHTYLRRVDGGDGLSDEQLAEKLRKAPDSSVRTMPRRKKARIAREISCLTRTTHISYSFWREGLSLMPHFRGKRRERAAWAYPRVRAVRATRRRAAPQPRNSAKGGGSSSASDANWITPDARCCVDGYGCGHAGRIAGGDETCPRRNARLYLAGAKG
eukprot:IDg21532t1